MTDTLDIVLLGAPAAGKTSLLGALVQAAETQTALLHGQVATVEGPLAELRQATYQQGPPKTRDEVQPIAMALEPPAGIKEPPITATLTDCSGEAAQAMMAAPAPLDSGSLLARAVLQADTVLLVVDASAAPAQLDRDFAQLGLFVRRFQEGRGRRADVGGFPVYLVLSKCDLLAKPSDTHGQWMQRIEEGKRRVHERFHEFVQEQIDLPFGGIDLHLWATAIKRPALADRPAKPQEPYGVAELFRQVFASARGFQRVRDQASGRLSLAVTGVLGLLAALGVAATLLFLLRPSAELVNLESQAQGVLAGATPAERLREPLDERLAALKQIQASPHFDALPEKVRADLAQAERELEAYQKLSREFSSRVPDPRFATREEELNEAAKKLGAFQLPPEYEQAWNETKLAKRMAQWQFDLQKLREAVKEEEAWVRQQTEQGTGLLAQGGLVLAKKLPAAERDAWFLQVKEYIEREPRHKRLERIAPGSSLNYDQVYKFQRVETARKEWGRTKEKLKELRTLTQ